jgi:hypothetical protein
LQWGRILSAGAVIIAGELTIVLLITGLRLLLFIVELVIRRIAEYSKGPMLAVSALIGSLAALAKAFM